MAGVVVLIGGTLLLAGSSRFGAWAFRRYQPGAKVAVAPFLGELFNSVGFFRCVYAANGIVAVVVGGLVAIEAVGGDVLFGVLAILGGSQVVLESQRIADTRQEAPPFGSPSWSSWFCFGSGIFLIVLGIASWVVVLIVP